MYGLKPWYSRRLAGVCSSAVRRSASPDLFTLGGTAAAGLAGVALALGWWPVALMLLALRLAGANLDGLVARERGVSRPWGAVLNELGDRASDLLMFAGLAVFAARYDAAVWVLAAAVAATLPTFVALSGAAAGARRVNGGPLGKTARCLVAVLMVALPGLLVPLSAWVVAGSLVTAGMRLHVVRRELAGTAPSARTGSVTLTAPDDVVAGRREAASTGLEAAR